MGLGVWIMLCLVSLNLGGMLVIVVSVMLLVKKCVSVRFSVLVLFMCSLLLGDVKLFGKCSGLLIGVLIMLVVRLLFEFCGMMWN